MKSIYQDILNRAYNTLFHPSVQWTRLQKKGFQVPRYPAPASETIPHDVHDFKTPYRDSMYYVRHDEVERSLDTVLFFSDPISESVPQKLLRLRLLEKAQLNNPEAIEEAKKKYEAENGQSVEQKIYINEDEDNDMSTFVQERPSREQMAALVRSQFEQINDEASKDVYETNLADDDRPELNEKVGFNINENDAVFRQLVIDLHTIIARFGERNAKRGYTQFFKGDPNYWHQLDNSFKPEQIKLVQGSINDEVSILDPSILKKEHNSNDYHKEVKQPYPIENQYYK